MGGWLFGGGGGGGGRRDHADTPHPPFSSFGKFTILQSLAKVVLLVNRNTTFEDKSMTPTSNLLSNSQKDRSCKLAKDYHNHLVFNSKSPIKSHKYPSITLAHAHALL